MPSSLEGLQQLLGGGMTANDPLQLARLRRSMMDQRSVAAEPGGPGGFGASPEFQADMQAEMQADPNTGAAEMGRIQGIEQQQAAENAYMQPGATAIRKNAEQLALQKLLAPIQMKGQYDVAAAQAKAQNSEDSQMRGFQQQSDLTDQRNQAQEQRASAMEATNLKRDRMRQLMGMQAKPPAGYGRGTGFMWQGDSQQDKDKVELQQLMGGGGAMPQQGAPAPSVSGPSSGGRIRVVGPNGEKGSITPGDPLPPGWRAQ